MPSINRFMGEKELPANVLYSAAMERQKNNNSVGRLGASAARVAAAATSRPSSAASTTSTGSSITRNNIKMRWVPKTARRRRNRRASRKARKSRKAGRR